MVAIEHTILISNLLVTIGLFIITAYRVKIERKQVYTIIKNAKAAEKIVELSKRLEDEETIFEGMATKDFIEFLKEFVKDAD